MPPRLLAFIDGRAPFPSFDLRELGVQGEDLGSQEEAGRRGSQARRGQVHRCLHRADLRGREGTAVRFCINSSPLALLTFHFPAVHFVQKPSKEDSSTKPWTGIAQFSLEAEKELQGMSGYPALTWSLF